MICDKRGFLLIEALMLLLLCSICVLILTTCAASWQKGQRSQNVFHNEEVMEIYAQ